MDCTNSQMAVADSTGQLEEVAATACPPVRPQADRFYAAVGLRLAALPLRRFATEAAPYPRAAHPTRRLTVAESAPPATQPS
jgi:hypothetical protein